MKIILSLFLLLSALPYVTAQQKPGPQAEAFFKRGMSQINPRHVTWVRSAAANVHDKNLSDADAKDLASQYGALNNLNDGDISALSFLVMMEASKSAQEDLKAIMAGVKSINEQKQKQRAMLSKMQQQRTMTSAEVDSFKLLRSITMAFQKRQNPETVKLKSSGVVRQQISKPDIDVMAGQMKSDLDAMSEMGEIQQLKLQSFMDRQNKLVSTLSNILKKISQTQESIIQNLK